MQASNRLILNTAAQYTRTIINVVLSLYSSRLILQILGESDFGIYSLVGGVVSLLSFLTNSLVTSTQRYLSVAQGKGDLSETKQVFNNSLIVHIVLGFMVLVVFLACEPLLFNGFLNIPVERIGAARIVYRFVVGMVIVALLAAPFRAVLVSRENIVYISVIDVLDGIFKLVFVYLLTYCTFDNLIAYGCIMMGITLFNMLSFVIYGMMKYDECIFPRRRYIDSSSIKGLLSFSGWTMYSSFCVIGRTQGVAIVLNKVMGTVVNAAYGIGGSLQGYISFVSSSFATAISPQLMKAKGAGDNKHMMYLSFFQCKMSYLLFALLAIPSIFEMDKLLVLWLGKVPENANFFGIMFLLNMLFDLLTSGLGTANSAIGRIKAFTVIVNTPKLLAVPLIWIALKFGCSLFVVGLLFVGSEIISMVLRIPMLRRLVDFSIREFIDYTLIRTIIPVLASVAVCFTISIAISANWRFLLTYSCSGIVLLILSYYLSLTKDEQLKVNSIICSLKNKILK